MRLLERLGANEVETKAATAGYDMLVGWGLSTAVREAALKAASAEVNRELHPVFQAMYDFPAVRPAAATLVQVLWQHGLVSEDAGMSATSDELQLALDKYKFFHAHGVMRDPH